jgi:cytochrome c-type biogenesis protein CcsB
MLMSSSLLLSIVTFVYLLAALLYVCHSVFKIQFLGRVATVVTVAGFLVNTTGIILRWMESYQLGSGHAPLSNMYESLVFFAWSIILIYLIIEWRSGYRSIGSFATPLAFWIMAYASFSSVDSHIQPLIPALKSNWLIAHVITCFLGYAAFGVSCAISVMYLFKGHHKREGGGGLLDLMPGIGVLEDISYRTTLIGFVMLSAGIITGAVWAHSAWGRYWSWDPKETWSLITWLVYATLLHARLMRGWEGKRIAILSVIGFVCVLFTYFGVNFLLSGLHSYGSS